MRQLIKNPVKTFVASNEWALFRTMPEAGKFATIVWASMGFLRGTLPALFAVATGWLFSTVQTGSGLAWPLFAVGLLFVFMNALGPVHEAVSWNLGGRISRLLHNKLMHTSLTPPGLAHLENPGLAEKLSSARDFDLGIAAPPLIASFPYLTSGLVRLAAGLTSAMLLAGYRWWAGLLAAAAWGSTHVLLRPGAVWHERNTPEVSEQQRRAAYEYKLLVDAPAAKEVRLFGLPHWIADGFTERRQRLVDLSWKARRLRAGPVRRAILAILAADIVILAALGRDAVNGNLSLAATFVFAQAILGVSSLAFSETDWWLSITAQPVPVINDLGPAMSAAGALPIGSRSANGLPLSEIEFRDVRFAYTADGQAVLDGLSLKIPAGTSMAVVGSNGAGKTTLAKLCCRMYDPVSGSIHIDGRDLKEFEIDSWRGRIAAVFQDFVRYDATLRYNVSPSGADDQSVNYALNQARAAGLAGLDTILSKAYPGGTDLSGGQWQRVALARAIAAVSSGAGVVILDEPTAQLDVKGEAEIFERLLESTQGKTTILISHRFSTVRRADRICVIEHGRVIELGSHDQLMSQDGRYRHMFELQASRFEDEPEIQL